jgi:hypothetical protein
MSLFKVIDPFLFSITWLETVEARGTIIEFLSNAVRNHADKQYLLIPYHTLYVLTLKLNIILLTCMPIYVKNMERSTLH